jgi:predicted permease
MILVRKFLLKLVRRRRLHSDLEAELAFHRDMAAEQGNARPFGNTTVLKESALDVWRFKVIENAGRDLELAMRRFRKNPAYTAAAIGSLALGIAISTAMFAILNVVAFRPLPYPDPKSLLWMTEVLKANSTDEITITPDFLDWRRLNRTFDSLAAFNYDTHIVTGLPEPVEVHSVRASATLLPILRVKPMLGRTFTTSEDKAGGGHVAIVSYAFWRGRLGGNTEILGKPILLDGEQYVLVGVLPNNFVFPGEQAVDIMTPLAKNETAELARDGRVLTIVRNVIGRLKPGVTIREAHADLSAIQAHLPLPPFHPTITIKMLPLRTYLFGDQRATASVLVIGSLLFLLIASANLGNLALSQLMQRDRELAVRRALGASRSRVVAQLVIENAAVAAAASAIGLIAALMIRNVIAALPQYQASFYGDLPVDGTVLLFAAGLLATVIVVFGLVPALRVSDIHLGAAIAAGQTSIAGKRHHLRYLSLVAALEIAVVVALASSAVLMLKSFWNMRYRQLGFESQHVIAATLNLSASEYDDERHELAFIDRSLTAVARIPGVERTAVSAAPEIPPGEGHATNIARIEGRSLAADSRHKALIRNQEVSAEYFRILHIPLFAGRFIRDSDGMSSTPVVVINHEFERRYFPRESAIGHRLQQGERQFWYTIVGVVGDVKSSGLAASPEPIVYTPWTQCDPRRLRELGILMRSALPLASIGPEFREVIAAIDPEQPVSSIETIDRRLNQAAARPRLTAELLTLLSILGTVIAVIGVYGLTACRARSQMRELAVRQALGAPASRLVLDIFATAGTVCAAGLICGLSLTFAAARLLSAMLFQVSAHDPAVLIAVASSVMAAAGTACVTPAWKASRLDPLIALREA